ncbi:MAG: prolyl oligopeptidase family serine peptidase, partial [Planctomycetales bacterium]|nr:prolyl oligopeptidase family serine peptidase [Planctomycetales bacterium]
ADYERAAQLPELTRNRVYRQTVRPNWLPDGGSFWYRVQTGRDAHEFVLVDRATGQRHPAFDHARVAELLTEQLKRDVDPDQLPIRSLEFAVEDGKVASRITLIVDRNRWELDRETNALRRVEGDNGASATTVRVLRRPQRSRDRGGETSIHFVNSLDRTVKLYWLDRGGAPVAYGELAAGAERDQHTFAGHVWMATDENDAMLVVFQAEDLPGDAVISEQTQVTDEMERPSRDRQRSRRAASPDGRWAIEVQDDNLVLVASADGVEIPLTTDGTAENRYLPRIEWSPDSTRFVAIQEEVGEKHPVYLIESAPKDQLQPRLHELDYTKPGDRIAHARPRLFHVDAKGWATRVEIAEALFPNPWSLSDVRWQADGSRFTFLYNERGHQLLRIVVVDGDTGEAAALLDERSDTFVDYAHKQYSNYLDATNDLIWMSERAGWNHLYRFDLRSGQLLNPITTGEWVVRRVLRVDEEQRQIWFMASGVYPEQDPYYLHLGRVGFDGQQLTFLTAGNGTHDVEFSPDGETFIDRYSRVDMAPVTELRRSSDGKLLSELERGDTSELAATGWRPPVRFVAAGRDGTTPIYGVIHFPWQLDANTKYPVVEKIYAGPQGSFVPKAFAAYHREQALAELGFIVVQMDGMGTSDRSKAFHDVCWHNLGDSGFPDRIAWMRAAAERYPCFDLERVGIYGGSAGGQSTVRGLLMYPNFYDVGVADCGCHDNRMDKIWWNELWMGYPIGPHYAEQSNVTQAHRLQGKLLLTVGELDRNVDPASTMQVVDALIKADKDFDLIVFPGADHGAGESHYGIRRRHDYFVRHLWGVEPRREP